MMSKYTSFLQRGYVVYSVGAGSQGGDKRVVFVDWHTGRFKDTMASVVRMLQTLDEIDTDDTHLCILMSVMSSFEYMECGDVEDNIIARINIDVDVYENGEPLIIASFNIYRYSEEKDDEDHEEIPMCLGSIEGVIKMIEAAFLKDDN